MQLMYLILYFIFAIIISTTTYMYTKMIVDKYNLNSIKLYDIGHEFLPDFSNYYIIADIFITILVFNVCILYADNFKVLSRFIIMILTLTIIKCFTQILTILPDPSNNECKVKHNALLKRIYGNCNDLMFSGHTAISILCIWFLQNRLKGWLIFLHIILAFVVAFLSITAKNHYSIDIVMAFFVVYVVWNELKLDYM